MSPPGPCQLVSFAVRPDDLSFVATLPGTRSANLREVVSVGVQTMKGQPLAPQAVADLRRIVDRLEALTARTPTGAWWAPTPEAMPSPDLLEPFDLVVMPVGLLLVAPNAALSFDMQEATCTLQGANHGALTIGCEPRDLIHLAAQFLPAVLQQAHEPTACELPLGMVLQHGSDDVIRLTLEGLPITLPLDLALAMAAELSSLAARSVSATMQRRVALEQALQEVGQ
jgi:hypothetical protein